MALMSPATNAADVDAHTFAFRTMCAELTQC
jgi:glutamate-1-semialdehyde 2,1-aminomutase